ncbi:MAG TPA: helix-turn-helix domain-containing protein [Phycisphaerae bacterium]|nr:helix-turn-helix domain-containing protein [Phycisphaerae bacterium]
MRRIEAYARRGRLRVAGGRGAKPVELPTSVTGLLVRILSEMAAGNEVRLMSLRRELTTQEAAEVLGVSRPFVVKEIREGRLKCRKVGTHRRLALRDVLTYRREQDAARREALEELSAQAQELGMGY